jgi:hypothetical protein
MEILAMLLVLVGLIAVLIGGTWFLVECFRESIWWGLGCLLINPIQFIFLFVHWSAAAKPFGIQMLGLGFLFAGSFLAGLGPFAGM